MDLAANRIAQGLLATGVRPGDHVAVMLPNCPEMVFLIFAPFAGDVGGSLLFSVGYVWSGVPAALGVFLLTMAALYLFGCLLGALFLFYGRDAWNLASALQEPVYFVSGFYFPVRSLTAAVGGVASLLPITLGLDGLRQLLLPGTPALVGPQWEALALTALIPVYGALAMHALRRIEQRARREGRLILRAA